MNKKELRKKFSLIRKSIENKSEKDFLISQKLQNIIDNYETFFTYVSFGSEVCTHEIIKNNIDKVYIPYTNGGEMKCLKYVGGELNADKLGNLSTNSYGSEGSPTLTIVPMLAFDSACYRLGYGGGYYDRFLSSAITVKIGIAYDEQFTDETFAEIFDVPLDMIITPTKLYRK